MGTPGYKISLKAPGTPTASTGNYFNLVAGTTKTYQIASTAKRVLARNVSPSAFKESTGGTTIGGSDIASVDYLFGKVTFSSTHTTQIVGTVTHLPLSVVAGANSMTLNCSRELLDDTDFSSTGFRSRAIGIADVSLSISRYDTLDQEWAHRLLSTSVLSTALSTGANELVVEIRPESTGKYAVGFFRLENENLSGDVSGLEGSELSLQLDGDSRADFKWSDQQ